MKKEKIEFKKGRVVEFMRKNKIHTIKSGSIESKYS